MKKLATQNGWQKEKVKNIKRQRLFTPWSIFWMWVALTGFFYVLVRAGLIPPFGP